MQEIERAHLIEGEETIPNYNASWRAWQYGKASSWVTLYNEGGYSNQPQSYLDDMDWFNTWDYYYSLDAERARLHKSLNNE